MNDKIRFFFIVICTILIVSCNQNSNNQKTIQEKDIIKTELSQLMDQIIIDSESLDLEKAIEPYIESEEFLSLSNGYKSNYKEFIKANRDYYPFLKSQKFLDSKYFFTFISETAVILTWECKTQVVFQDDSGYSVAPYIVSFLFKKTNEKWGIHYAHGSGSIVNN